jgi:hypothetical protein
MLPDPVANTLEGAKNTLADASKTTHSSVGDSVFAPKEIPPHIGGVPSYKAARSMRPNPGRTIINSNTGL